MTATHTSSASDHRALIFGSCVLDRSSGRLTRDNHVIPLAPKAYDVLAYLAEHAGHLVTKQELFDALWADVFVGDAALKVCIGEIRKALDDDARDTIDASGRVVSPSRTTSRRRTGADIASSPP